MCHQSEDTPQKYGRIYEDDSAADVLERRSFTLQTVQRLAVLIALDDSTVRGHLNDDDVPRCDERGYEKEGGRYVFVADYLRREDGNYFTDRRRRQHLRSAGELPSAER